MFSSSWYPQYHSFFAVFLVLSAAISLSSCIDKPIVVSLEATVVEACGDGIDNDHDGWTDLQDHGCSALSDTDEGGYSDTACNDGVDNDGDGYVDSDDALCLMAEDDAEDLGYGDVLITEIMADPNAVSDADGEWLELYNNTDQAIDIAGWVLKDGDRQHIIHTSLIIAAKSYAVLSRADNSVNGLPAHHQSLYRYESLILTNSGGSLTLENAVGLVVSTLAYDTTEVAAGKSLGLDGALLRKGNAALLVESARQSRFWCFSESLLSPEGDKATPAAVNDNC